MALNVGQIDPSTGTAAGDRANVDADFAGKAPDGRRSEDGAGFQITFYQGRPGSLRHVEDRRWVIAGVLERLWFWLPRWRRFDSGRG